jgi:hypothetical protein
MITAEAQITQEESRSGEFLGRILNYPTRIIFYLVFVLVFLLSGTITMLHVIPYRMGLVSILVLPLFLIHKFKIDRVLLAYVLLAVVILFSAVINGSSLYDLALFLRTLVFSYLIYYIVNVYINKNNIVRIFRLCVWIGVIQFPIVILQQVLYEQLPSSLIVGVSHTDFDFGTFNFKGDAPMAFFLVQIVIFLLFNRQRRYIIKYRWFVIVWLTLTILYMNSQFSKLLIIGVWLVYLFYHLSFKRLVYSGAAAVIVLGLLGITGTLQPIVVELRTSFISNTTAQKIESFQSGSYGRGAAFSYYVSQGINWFGDGPSKYYNPITREFVVGNTGHIFTFYAEVGFLGMALSYVVLYLMLRARRPLRVVSVIDILSFISIVGLSVMTAMMNDISVILTFCIFSRQYLIPPLKLTIR